MDSTNVLTTTRWSLDRAHSEIGFRVKHLMIANVRGSFSEFNGSVQTTGDDFLNAEINFELNPASIQTGEEGRDNHLRSSDFFDVKTFKDVRFFGNIDKQLDEKGRYKLHGELTMRGIQKRISLDVQHEGIVKDPSGNHKSMFKVKGKINRKDWGLNWNKTLEAGGVLVSEEVWIECNVQLIRES